MISGSDNFGGDGCSGTDTIGTGAVSYTTLGSGSVWGATNVDFVVNSDGNEGGGGVVVIVVSVDFVAGMAQLSVAVFLLVFYYFPQMKLREHYSLVMIRE